MMTRNAISNFFDVTPDRIYRSDNLDEIYNARDFEPQFYFFVINFVFEKQLGRWVEYKVDPSKIETIDDLALLINRRLMEAQGL